MTDETQEVKICPTCSVQWAPREPNVIKITNQRIWLLSPIPCPDCDERQKEWLADVGRGLAEKLEIAVLPDLAEKYQQMNAESVKAWRSLMDVGIDDTFWRAFVEDNARQQFDHLQRMFNACSSANDVLLEEKLQFDNVKNASLMKVIRRLYMELEAECSRIGRPINSIWEYVDQFGGVMSSEHPPPW